MVDAGMDGCRLNMSHCSYELATRIIESVRRVASERGRPLAVGGDLKGPKLRIGEVRGGEVELHQGAALTLTTEPRLSDAVVVSVDYPYLCEGLRPGDPVLLNDGFIQLRVETLDGNNVACRVEKGGLLTSRKGLNLPGKELRVPLLTDKDLQDMAFAVHAGADFLYLSYARSAVHIREARAALERLGSSLPLVAKIERRDGVDRLAEIVDAADGICVARGDLGIEVPIGEVPGIQREASRLCRAAGKFVMNGGQLLTSMVANPVPLRAEVSDLATVVRDDLDAIVLSDETAAGAYPVEAVRIAAHVLELTERYEAGAVIGGSHPDPLIIQATSPQKANWLSTWRGVFPVLSSPGASPDAVRIAAGVAYPGLGDTSALKIVAEPTD